MPNLSLHTDCPRHRLLCNFLTKHLVFLGPEGNALGKLLEHGLSACPQTLEPQKQHETTWNNHHFWNISEILQPNASNSELHSTHHNFGTRTLSSNHCPSASASLLCCLSWRAVSRKPLISSECRHRFDPTETPKLIWMIRNSFSSQFHPEVGNHLQYCDFPIKKSSNQVLKFGMGCG
jgi:hypothetical protein